MDNVLKAIIKIEAPGLQQTTNQVAAAVGKTEQSLKTIPSAGDEATKSLVRSFDTIIGSSRTAGDEIAKLQEQVSKFGGGAASFTAPKINSGVAITSLNELEAKARQVEKALRAATDLPSFNKLGAELLKIDKQIEALKSNIGGISFARTFNELSVSAAGASQNLSALQRQVQSFGGGVKAFDASALKATATLSRLRPASNDATLSLINLGRVVQDAPFGFLGIANNLNPLFESFGRASKGAGGFRGALKALGSSLTGAGGLSLAVSVVSTGLILFGDKLFNTGKKADEAEDKLKKYKETVEGIFKGVAKEASETAGLVAILKSETETRERKLAALKELKEIQPEIFGQLKLEGEAVAGVDAAYKTYLENLRVVVAAKVKQFQLEQLITKQLQLQGATLTKSEKELKDAIDQTTDAISNSFSTITGNPFADKVKSDREKTKKEINTIEGDIQKLIADITELSNGIEIKIPKPTGGKDAEAEIKRFAKAIQEVLITPEPIIFKSFDTDKEALSKAKATIEGFMRGSIFKLKIQPEISFSEPEIKQEISQLSSELIKVFDKNIQGTNVSFKAGAILGKDFVDGVRSTTDQAEVIDPNLFQATNLETKFKSEFEKFGLSFQKFAKIDLSKSFFINSENLTKQLEGISKAFQGATLAAEFASTAFSSAFDALLSGENAIQAIGNALKALIVDLIKAAIRALVLKAIVNVLLPGAGSAVGAAAKGAGAIGQLLGGGISGLSPGQSGGAGFGGGISVVVSGQLVGRGNDLVAVVTGTNQSQGRAFIG
jgi:hypothetical protein